MSHEIALSDLLQAMNDLDLASRPHLLLLPIRHRVRDRLPELREDHVALVVHADAQAAASAALRLHLRLHHGLPPLLALLPFQSSQRPVDSNSPSTCHGKGRLELSESSVLSDSAL